MTHCLRICLTLILAALASQAYPQQPKGNGAAGKIVPAAKYECLLGVYSNDSKRTPFVTLAIPDGSNMLSDDVMSAIRGKISLGEISYVGKGYFFAPNDGSYEIDCNYGTVNINGRAMKFGRKPGTIDLKKGIYELEIADTNHGQPYVAKGKITIRLARTAQQIPIYNSGKGVQRFLGASIGGSQVIPVSKFDPESAILDAKQPKR